MRRAAFGRPFSRPCSRPRARVGEARGRGGRRRRSMPDGETVLKVTHTGPIPGIDKRPTKGAVISTLRKTLVSLAIVGIAGAVAGTGAFSAFSKTTSNDNNTITAGDVTITNDSPTTASYSLPTAKPGDSASRCIQVTYNGSLSANVKFYRSALSGNTGL